MLATVYSLNRESLDHLLEEDQKGINAKSLLTLARLDGWIALELGMDWELVSFFITSLPPVPHHVLGQEECKEDQALLGGKPIELDGDTPFARLIDSANAKEIASALAEIPEKIQAYRDGFMSFWDYIRAGEYGYYDRDVSGPAEYCDRIEVLFQQLVSFYDAAARQGHSVVIACPPSGT